MALDVPGLCLSCNVTAGRIQTPGGVVYEDDGWHLTHQVSPALLAGWLILQPQRHVESLAALTAAEASSLGTVLSTACRALEAATKPDRVYAFSFGESVRHLHFYLIPRREGMTPGPGLLDELFAGRWACSDEEAANVAVQVRQALSRA